MSAVRPLARAVGREIRVRGVVQGVGFRPSVWRLARACGLTGEVRNDAQGVLIRVWGEEEALDRFVQGLASEAPPLARIDALESSVLEALAPPGEFRIAASAAGEVHTSVAADAATCSQCLADIRNSADRRFRYPFTNCTHCGPRLSIVRTVPYDRAHTSMAAFPMCPDCRREYDDPGDRRFHAQPNACPACGPRVWLEDARGSALVPAGDAIEVTARLLRQGAIVAIRGLGGFHLACDACNAEAVTRLRARKRRYDKPFALMARDTDLIRRYCALGGDDAATLASPAAPIVILPVQGPHTVAEAVAPGQRTLGFMLPYTPLHRLLLADLDRPLVLTSGNVSDEPQCIGNPEARDTLLSIADYALMHDREIVNRLDDSVVRVLDGAPRMLRRARGHAPAPLPLPRGFERAPDMLALGGELKNTFCLVKDGQAVVSQHMGDLEDAATFADYRNNLELYARLFEHTPGTLVVDSHPEYLSTKLGQERAEREALRLETVQHHHAHIASCIAEHGLPRDTAPVLGVALDGLGYGDDETLWGGEFLLADYMGFERLAALAPVAMPGGAQAMREPWRNTYAHIEAAMGWPAYKRAYAGLELTRFLETKPLATLDAMIANGVNSPLASSCGRLFDAVAAAIGIRRERAGYEGQAAIELEALVDLAALDKGEEGYPFNIFFPPCGLSTAPRGARLGWGVNTELATLDPGPMWRALLDDLARHTPASSIAARFHAGLAHAIVSMTVQLTKHAGQRIAHTVALSGGVFQNRVLLEQVAAGLRAQDFTALSQRQVPANDGGLSLGQAAVAAARALALNNNQETLSCV